MGKFNYTRKEIDFIKSQIYLTSEEEQILDMWLLDKSIVETALKLNMSERTVCRKRKSIITKIKRVG